MTAPVRVSLPEGPDPPGTLQQEVWAHAAPPMALWGDMAMMGSPGAVAARHQARPELVMGAGALTAALPGAVTWF